MSVTCRPDRKNGFHYNQILVFSLQDIDGEDIPIRLYYLDDLTAELAKLTQQELAEDPVKTLCISAHLPYVFTEEQIKAFAPVVAMINNLLMGMVLRMGTREGVWFEHRSPHLDQAVDHKVVVEMVDTLNNVLLQFTPIIRAYGLKEVSAQKCKEKLSQLLLEGKQ